MGRKQSIVSKHGDNGYTRLGSGAKVTKYDSRVECYGTIDELVSFCGLAAESLPSRIRVHFAMLQDIMETLMTVASKVSMLQESHPGGITGDSGLEQALEVLEHDIQRMERELAPLNNFIYPVGCLATSIFHVCRTICRRAERRLWYLNATYGGLELAGRYLNRLSDWFFVAARFVNHLQGIPEKKWSPM